MEILFLSLDEVLEIHQQQIERYGGSLGIRDVAGLESAVATPEATFGGEYLHTSIPAMAAAYLFHLCQNHAFIDGNKRAGANAAITFLLMNDWEPMFDEAEFVALVLSIASGKMGKPKLIEISNRAACGLKMYDLREVFQRDEAPGRLSCYWHAQASHSH
jgi:death on curing protein